MLNLALARVQLDVVLLPGSTLLSSSGFAPVDTPRKGLPGRPRHKYTTLLPPSLLCPPLLTTRLPVWRMTYFCPWMLRKMVTMRVLAAQPREEAIPQVYKLLVTPLKVFGIFAFSVVWAKC